MTDENYSLIMKINLTWSYLKQTFEGNQMPSIKISELRPVDSELFQDSESFLDELSERETSDILGGGKEKIGVISLYTEGVWISILTFSIVTKGKIKIKVKNSD